MKAALFERIGKALVLMRLNSLTAFFFLTFALSWVCWTAAGRLIGGGAESGAAPAFGALLVFVGAFSPALVAIVLVARTQGVAKLKEMLARLFEGDVAARWFLFAIGFGAFIRLSAALIYRLWTGDWPTFGMESVFIIAAAIVVGLPYAAGEEVGWRGFALPRLVATVGLARASLLLGVIHAFWHFPLFFLSGHGLLGQSFPMYLLMVTALSVAFTWLFANTGGSLLLATLFHSAWNQTTGLVPTQLNIPGSPFAFDTQLITILVVTLLWAFAFFFLLRMTKGAAPGHRAP